MNPRGAGRAFFGVYRRALRGERGVALLLALMVVTIMTLTVVDFAYVVQIDSNVAANNSDDLRAFYLARSAVRAGLVILQDFQGILQSACNKLSSHPCVSRGNPENVPRVIREYFTPRLAGVNSQRGESAQLVVQEKFLQRLFTEDFAAVVLAREQPQGVLDNRVCFCYSSVKTV